MTMDYAPVHRPQRTRISKSLEPPLPRIHRLPLLRRRAGERFQIFGVEFNGHKPHS